MGFEKEAIWTEMEARAGKGRPSREHPYGTGDATKRTVDAIVGSSMGDDPHRCPARRLIAPEEDASPPRTPIYHGRGPFGRAHPASRNHIWTTGRGNHWHREMPRIGNGPTSSSFEFEDLQRYHNDGTQLSFNDGHENMRPSIFLTPSPLMIATPEVKRFLVKNNDLLTSFGNNRYLDNLMYRISKNRLRRLSEKEKSIEDIVDTTFSYYGLGNYLTIQSQQIKSEIIGLAKLVANKNPRTIVEIGTVHGGTLYIWSRINYDTPKIIVSIDLPGGPYGGGYPKQKEKFYSDFNTNNTLHLIRADSHQASTKNILRDCLQGKKIDYLFLDGDHTYDGVRMDFNLYKEFINDKGIVAFHDILPNKRHPECGVHEFWEEISREYESKVFIDSYEQGWAGIGVLLF